MLRYARRMNARGSSNAVLDSERLAADSRSFYEALSELLRVYQFRDRDRICCYDVSITQCYALEALSPRSSHDSERSGITPLSR